MSVVLKLMGVVDLAAAYYLFQIIDGFSGALAVVFVYKGLMSLL